MRKLFVSTLAIVLGLALAACDEDNSNWTYDGTTDIGTEAPPGDVTPEPGTDVIPEPTTDIGVDTAPDGTGDCAHTLGTFAPTEILAGEIGEGWWTVRAPLSGGFESPLSMLDIEVNPAAGGPSGPTTVNITTFAGIGACSTCIIIVEGCATSLSDCTGYWMAEQATLDITALSVSVGSPFTATLSGVVMTAWDPGSDTAIPGDSYCVDMWSISTTFTDSATW